MSCLSGGRYPNNMAPNSAVEIRNPKAERPPLIRASDFEFRILREATLLLPEP